MIEQEAGAEISKSPTAGIQGKRGYTVWYTVKKEDILWGTGKRIQN